jgi:hypothetical protein
MLPSRRLTPREYLVFDSENSENFVAAKTFRTSRRPLPSLRLSLVLEPQGIIFYQTKGVTSSFWTMGSFNAAWTL